MAGGLLVNKPTWSIAPRVRLHRLFSFDANGSLHCRMAEQLR